MEEKRNRLEKNQWYEGDFAMGRTVVWQILAKAKVRRAHNTSVSREETYRCQ